MSGTTRLLVLGVVRLFQPVHGYEVRRELITWHASEWASVKPGSIYNALKSLTSDGLLEVVSTDQVGGRPERTTYRLTLAGEDEFRGLLRDAWWKVRPVIDPLMGAVSFLGMISREEASGPVSESMTSKNWTTNPPATSNSPPAKASRSSTDSLCTQGMKSRRRWRNGIESM